MAANTNTIEKALNQISLSPGLLLQDHHREIEAICMELRRGTYDDDSLELVETYRSCERAILEHIALEDEEMLPGYEVIEPDDARVIRGKHDELCRQLCRIGIDVDLHCIRAEMIESLILLLREHVAHENRGLYLWAQLHLPLRIKRTLFTRVGESLRMLEKTRPAAVAAG